MKENITDIDKSINRRLREIREYLDLTQKEFADVLQVKQSYYSDLENGKREVTTKTVRNLVNIWGFSANWIFTGEGDLYITKVDNKVKTDNQNSNWTINDSINANNKSNSDFPFYLDLHIDKKLILDFIKMNNDLGKLYDEINKFTTFNIVIESIDRLYFSKIRTAEKNRDDFYRGTVFDYEGFLKGVTDEVEKVMRFKSALENINMAIEKFYQELKEIDEHAIVDNLYGRT